MVSFKALRSKKIATPAASTILSDEIALYPKSDNAFYTETSAGLERRLAYLDETSTAALVAGIVTEARATGNVTISANSTPTQPPGIIQTIAVVDTATTYVLDVDLEYENSGGSAVWYIDLLVDGTPVKTVLMNTNERNIVSLSIRVGNLSVGSHTFSAQINKSAGQSVIIYAGNFGSPSTLSRVTAFRGVSAASTQFPYFKGSNRSATSYTVGTNIPFSTRTDPNAAWSTSNNTWTVPIGGRYKVTIGWKTSTPAVTAGFQILKNGSIANYSPNTPNAVYSGLSVTHVDQYAAGDTIAIRTDTAFTTQVDTGDNNYVIIEWMPTAEVASVSAMVLDSNYSNTAYATSNPSATSSTPIAIPGMSLTVPVKSTSEVFEFYYSVDGQSAANDYCVITHWVDGVRAPGDSYLSSNVQVRGVLSKTLRVTGLSPGNHTFETRLSAIGSGPASAFAGHSMMMVKRISGAGLISDTGWIAWPNGTGVVTYGGAFQAPQYRRIGSQVMCRGLLGFSAAVNAGATIGTLPIGFRPPAQEIGTAMGGDNVTNPKAIRYDISPAGLFTCSNSTFAANASNFLSLNGVGWYID